MTERHFAGRVSGFYPKRRLGQHFLVDRNLAAKIVSLAGFGPGDVVLEIGPGRGALTLPLSMRAGRVVAVEKDPVLAEGLRRRVREAEIANVQVITHDILRWDLHQVGLPDREKIQVIGNLPYNISSPVLEMLVQGKEMLGRAVLMFQTEMAMRLTAVPGTKAYGAMTVLVGYHAEIGPLLRVGRNSFIPRPKVDSMVLQLDFQKPYPRRTADEEMFHRVVRGAFAYRRKTIWNSLKTGFPNWPTERVLAAFKKCGIAPNVRAEALDVEAYLCLSDRLSVDNPPAAC